MESLIILGPNFPTDDLHIIANRLSNSGVLVPGFIAPPAGLLALNAMVYAARVEQTTTVILPDRNIASRMARTAREGVVHPLDGPTQAAVDLMALSQLMEFVIEPSIAFHELAHRDGDQVANDELRWFRAAEREQASAWIDIALGRANHLKTIALGPTTELELARPLHRYRCNYAVALRIAALELDHEKTPLQRAEALCDWMVSDFIVAGPAAVFAAMFLSPRASRAGMIKYIRSPDRRRAIDGVRNAAWDITHLSEFARHVSQNEYSTKRFIFATADRALAQLAQLIFGDDEGLSEFERQLCRAIEPWWAADANSVTKLIINAVTVARQRPPPTAPIDVGDYIAHVIELGERGILDFVPI
jgi:hypothetical protein